MKSDDEKNNPIFKKAIPTLPDELMIAIFNELTFEERLPLADTCNRYRELDFEVGGKVFDRIDVFWVNLIYEYLKY